MPRRKLTEQEIDDAREQGFARLQYLAAHPEERAKEQNADHMRVQRAAERRLKKHQPVVTDISFNGQYVHVAFVRNNGEHVVGLYALHGWGRSPANADRQDRKARKFLAKVRAEDVAPGTPPPGPARTPRS